jgi:hypothetical protein
MGSAGSAGFDGRWLSLLRSDVSRRTLLNLKDLVSSGRR